MTQRVGANGQVVIPAGLRIALGIEPGGQVDLWIEDDHVAIRPVTSRRPLRGRFRGSTLITELARSRAERGVQEDQARENAT